MLTDGFYNLSALTAEMARAQQKEIARRFFALKGEPDRDFADKAPTLRERPWQQCLSHLAVWMTFRATP